MYREEKRMRDRRNRAEGERQREARNGEDAEGRGGREKMEGELRWIANSSHINKREDTVCEAAEKPPSL